MNYEEESILPIKDTSVCFTRPPERAFLRFPGHAPRPTHSPDGLPLKIGGETSFHLVGTYNTPVSSICLKLYAKVPIF